MKRRDTTDWTRPWWAGFFVLAVSITVLAVCTFFEVKNPVLIEVWKYTLFTSLGYVVGIPIGAIFSDYGKTSKEKRSLG